MMADVSTRNAVMNTKGTAADVMVRDVVDNMMVRPLCLALCQERSTIQCQFCNWSTNPETLINLPIFSR
jgi:hypothetical protein